MYLQILIFCDVLFGDVSCWMQITQIMRVLYEVSLRAAKQNEYASIDRFTEWTIFINQF